MIDCYISGIKKAALQRAALFIYFSATTAAAVITAYAEDNKKCDNYKPNDLIIEKFAEAVIHSGFLSYCLNCRGLLPLHFYCMKAEQILTLFIFQDKNKQYCVYGELCNTPDC